MEKMGPIRLKPAYQHYIWGGNRIVSHFHRDLPSGRYAESWEVSDRHEGMSVVASGKWQGKSLKELLATYQDKIVGKGKDWKTFPLLVKIIDAKENLSVQVHPNAECAFCIHHQPKSEMWVALAPSRVYAGLKSSVTKEQFVKALELGHVDSVLSSVDLQEGEAIFIPAGQIHAICSGAFLLEVQQNSNTTYRLHDWGRGRELHLEEGLLAIDWNLQQSLRLHGEISKADGHHRLASLIANSYFIVERLDILDRWQIKSHGKTCQILFCVAGEAMMENEKVLPGDTFLIPADAPLVSIQGKCQFLVMKIP